MKFANVAIISALTWISAAQQLSSANITACGISCLLVTVPAANCSLTNTTCQCHSTALPILTATCMLQNCTMHDSLILAKVQASVCDLPHPNHSTTMVVVAATVFSVTTVIIILRIISKSLVNRMLGAEDWIMLCALAFSIPPVYFTIAMSKKGFGKHLWDLNDGALLRILEDLYIAENVYVVDLALTKISVLVFYLRIFALRWFRYVAFATIGMIAISTTIISLMTIFSCKPVPYFWNRDIHGGTCIQINKLAYANSAMSIIQDLLIVALPMPVLKNMSLGRKKKIGLGFMFVIGSFGCVISMIRLKALLSFGNSLDPTWDYVNTVILTIMELAVAMTCACLPALRNLLTWLFPRSPLSSTRQFSDGNNNTNSTNKNHFTTISEQMYPSEQSEGSVELHKLALSSDYSQVR